MHTLQTRVAAPSRSRVFPTSLFLPATRKHPGCGGGRQSDARASERRISGGGTTVELRPSTAIWLSSGWYRSPSGRASGCVGRGSPTRNLLRLRLADCRPPLEGYRIHTSREKLAQAGFSSCFSMCHPSRTSIRDRAVRPRPGPINTDGVRLSHDPRRSRSVGCVWVPDSAASRRFRDDKRRGSRMCESGSPEGAVMRCAAAVQADVGGRGAQHSALPSAASCSISLR
jgi:hypothetical protein